MPTENFLSYTEVDPDADLTVTESRITVTTMIRNVAAYVYRDKGVGHFSKDFNVQVDIQATQETLDSGYFGCFMLANNVGAWASQLASNDYISVMVTWTGAIYNVELYARYAGGVSVEDTSGTGISVNTTYYLTITRVGSVITVYVYSDSSRTTLVYSLTCNPGGVSAFQYVYGTASRNDASYNPTAEISGFVENMNLNERRSLYPFSRRTRSRSGLFQPR